MTLKTTVEQLGDNGLYWAASPTELGELIHDAREAHWYRLLAWGYGTGRLQFDEGRKKRAHTARGGVTSRNVGAPLTWLFFSDSHPLDADGFPVRTPELEAALRKAMEER